MTSIAPIPDRPFEVFVAGNDHRIWNNNMNKKPFEIGTTITQLQMTSNGKALLAGVGEANKPGSVFIFKV